MNSLAFFIQHDNHDAVTDTQSLFYLLANYTSLASTMMSEKFLIVSKSQNATTLPF